MEYLRNYIGNTIKLQVKIHKIMILSVYQIDFASKHLSK